MKTLTLPISVLLLGAADVDALWWGSKKPANMKQHDRNMAQKRTNLQAQTARANENLAKAQARQQVAKMGNRVAARVPQAPAPVQVKRGVIWDEMLGMEMPDDIRQNMIRLNQNYVNTHQNNRAAAQQVQQARKNLMVLQKQTPAQVRHQQNVDSGNRRLQTRKAEQQQRVVGALPVLNRKHERVEYPAAKGNKPTGDFHDSVDLVDAKGVSLSSRELWSLVQQTSVFINNNRHLNANNNTMKQAQSMLKELQERYQNKLILEEVEARNLNLPTVGEGLMEPKKQLPKSFNENMERKKYLQVDSDWKEVEKKIAEWQEILDDNKDVDSNHRVKKPMMKLLEEMKEHLIKLKQQHNMQYLLEQNLMKKFHGTPSNPAYQKVWGDYLKIKQYFFKNPNAKVTEPYQEKILSQKDDGHFNIWGRKENIPGILTEFGKRAGKSPMENQLAAALYIRIIAQYAQQMHDHVSLHPKHKSDSWGNIARRMFEFIEINKNKIPGVKVGNGYNPLPIVYNETKLLQAMAFLGFDQARIPSQYDEHFEPTWELPKASGGGGGGGGGGHFKEKKREMYGPLTVND